jgi:hypothetical protein
MINFKTFIWNNLRNMKTMMPDSPERFVSQARHWGLTQGLNANAKIVPLFMPIGNICRGTHKVAYGPFYVSRYNHSLMRNKLVGPQGLEP